MPARPRRATPFTLATVGALVPLLFACDQLDVTSSPELPSARCASCHLPEYLGANQPRHRGVKPTTCATCHLETSFHPARLEHSFPLTGAHEKADCFACHSGTTPVFEGTPKSCATCHASEHEHANQSVPRHQTFGDDCAHCHGTSAWKPTLEERPGGDDSLVPPAKSEVTSAPPDLVPTSPPSATRAGTTTSPRPARPASATTPRSEPATPGSKRKRPDSVSGASPVRGR